MTTMSAEPSGCTCTTSTAPWPGSARNCRRASKPTARWRRVASRISLRGGCSRAGAPWLATPRCVSWGPVASVGGSGGNRRLRLRIVGWVEFLSVARTKRTIVDGAANLEEEIGPSPRPAHVLRFVHPPIDQEIGRPLRDRGTNPQAGTVPLGVIDHPVALAGEIAI